MLLNVPLQDLDIQSSSPINFHRSPDSSLSGLSTYGEMTPTHFGILHLKKILSQNYLPPPPTCVTSFMNAPAYLKLSHSDFPERLGENGNKRKTKIGSNSSEALSKIHCLHKNTNMTQQLRRKEKVNLNVTMVVLTDWLAQRNVDDTPLIIQYILLFLFRFVQ